MEDYNRNERYQSGDRISRNERNFEMNWDRNPTHYNRENRNVYSSDRENEYWNARNNARNAYPEGNYANRASDRYYNERDWNNRYNDYRNEYEHRNSRYSDRYNDYENMNDYHTGYYLNYPGANSYRDRNYQWHDNDRGWWDKTKDEVASWFGDEDAERRRRRDEMRNGPHRGKGPKNYTRSEERIREDVSDKLSEDSFLDASAIEVSVQDGEVT